MYDYSDNDNNGDLLQQAAELADVGKVREARSLIKQALRNANTDVEAWWALTQLASSDAERRYALKEVLARDPENPHALLMRDQLAAGTLPSLDGHGISRPNIKPNAPYGAKMSYMQPKDYLVPALATLVLYWLFWIAGLGLNLYYLNDARRLERDSGRQQQNVGCLKLLLGVYVVLPLAAIVLIGILAVSGNLS